MCIFVWSSFKLYVSICVCYLYAYLYYSLSVTVCSPVLHIVSFTAIWRINVFISLESVKLSTLNFVLIKTDDF